MLILLFKIRGITFVVGTNKWEDNELGIDELIIP
jgi:hypothetical protein